MNMNNQPHLLQDFQYFQRLLKREVFTTQSGQTPMNLWIHTHLVFKKPHLKHLPVQIPWKHNSLELNTFSLWI